MSNRKKSSDSSVSLGVPRGDGQSVPVQERVYGPMLPASPKRTTTRILLGAGLWGNFSTIVPITGSIALTPYLIHGFGVKRWGLFILLSAITSLFGPLGGGIGPAVGRFFSIHAATGNKRKLTETLLTSCLIAMILGGIVTATVWFLAPSLVTFFGAAGSIRAEGIFLLRAAGVAFGAALLQSIYSGLFSSHQAYALINVLSVVGYGAWATLMVLSVKFGYGLRGAAVALIAQPVVCLLVLVPASAPMLSKRIALLSWTDTKTFFRFAASTQGMSLVGLINEQLDSILVGGFFHLTSLTYFNSGANFAMQVRGVAYNFLGPPGTHLARSYGLAGEQGALKDFRRLQRLWVIGVAGWSTVALGASYFGVVAWLGPRFVVAGEVAAVFMVGNAINLCTGMLTQYLAAIGRPDLEVRYGVFSAVINIVLTIPALLIGPVAVAATTALGSAVASIYLVRIVRNNGFRRQPAGLGREGVPSFLKEIPVVPALFAGLVTVGLELAVRRLGLGGPLGLLVCGVPAAVGLMVFGLLVLRGRVVELFSMARSRRIDIAVLVSMLAD